MVFDIVFRTVKHFLSAVLSNVVQKIFFVLQACIREFELTVKHVYVCVYIFLDIHIENGISTILTYFNDIHPYTMASIFR